MLSASVYEQQFVQLRQRARGVLQPFVGSNGSVRFDCPAHIASATKV